MKGLVSDMQNKIRDEKLEFLLRGILTLDNIDECYHFFEDLCTVSELQEMSRRLLAAKMLKENYIYTEIAQQTGLSTATISRVNRCLKYGNDGYITVLDRLERIKKY
jgi:TrpR-related protein YerC/YecD